MLVSLLAAPLEEGDKLVPRVDERHPGTAPAQHHPLDPYLVQGAELLGDLGPGPDEDARSAELVRGMSRQLALDVGRGTPGDGARHQGPAHPFRRASGIPQELVQVGAQLREALGGEKDRVPLVGVAGRKGERAPRSVAADDDGRAAGPWGPDLQHGVAQPVELALERDRLLVPEQPGDYLQPLLEPNEAAARVQQLEAERLVLALLPACAD